jgi:hypothetical protein
MDVLGQLGSGAQAREGADRGAAADVAALEVGEGADAGAASTVTPGPKTT